MPLTMAPDVNVLLAGSRTDHPHHRPALRWLRNAIAACGSGGSVEILPMVAAGFLRLATHPRIFINPTTIDAAVAFIDSLLAVEGVDMPVVGAEWPLLKRAAVEGQLAANDIPDAWIAAAIRTSGGHLVTFDRGFVRLLGRSELTVLDTR
jgi:toxin-antitoxin system PIN domain toxin